MHYLLTGGAGFIGSHLVDLLLQKGHEVTVIDSLIYAGWRNIAHHLGNPRLHCYEQDITQECNLVFKRQQFSGVFHFAAVSSVAYSFKYPHESQQVNYQGTCAIVEESIRHQVPRFVFASSAAVYGDATTLPTKETAAYAPLSPYAEQKMESEQVCKEAYRRSGLASIALRLFNVYGPRQRIEGGYAAVVPSFILAARHGQPMLIYGDGEQTRDFLHATDAAAAAYAAMECPNPELYGTACNIGSGTETTIYALASLIRSEMKPYLGICHKDPAPGPRRSCADISRAEQLLGWRPHVVLEEGLRRTIEYFTKFD